MSEGAARIGEDYLGGVTFVAGYEPLDTTGYTVTAKHKHEGAAQGTESVTTVTPSVPDKGRWKFFIPGADITDPDADLLVEFTISGSPTINSPDAPLRIPTRAPFSE